MVRREFIRLASLAAGALPLLKTVGLGAVEPGAAAASGVADSSALPSTELQRLFLDPPNKYRPMVRWWWNGDRVTSDEVLRELDVMQKAGIGGVEINPIKFPSEADPGTSKALTWMSDEWIAVLESALQGTKARGMTCDMIVGSGWPYGGEFLSREDQTQMMALGTREFTGPQQVRVPAADLLADVSPRFVSPYKDALKDLVTATLVPYELSDVHAAVPVAMHEGDDSITVDVPAGRHVLYYLVKLTGFMAVINGAPGASGPVLNHYSAPAVSRYLDRISDRLTAKVGPLGDHFRAFFTDSIELEGENWCDDMYAEFSRRRGYDLAPFLPFVLFKVGEMGNAISKPYGANFSPELAEQVQLVRYDFETTKHELFQERFVATFVSWCTRVGVKSRMQAYGMECDVIACSMMLDIPECETWINTEEIQSFGDGDYRRGRSYTMINKFVSSAAHLAGKQLISCEEMTNTDDPFHCSMERIKVAGDQSMLSGVTQSVLHGFNYNPLSAPFPGWVRYGTFFNERNTWWPYFKLWTDYKARLSAIFQHAEMQADIAILPAQADLASKYGFQRDPFPRTVYPPYLFKLWEVIHQNGSGCDYLSEDIIRQSTVSGGRLVFRGRSYKAIVLPEVESMHPATAKQLHALAASGGTVLFLGKTPHRSAGLQNEAQESAEVLQLITDMCASYPQRTPRATVSETDMVGWYRTLQQRYALAPDVVISKPTDFISQLRYSNGEQDIFFFTHYGPEDRLTFEAIFNTGEKTAWLWNTESGTRSRLPVAGAKNVLTLSLGPSESQLIVFEPSSAEDASSKPHAEDRPGANAHSEPISGPWNVRLAHVDGTEKTISLPGLVDFNQREDLKAFAGTITYSKELVLQGSGQRRWLDLGEVRAVSELAINGKPLGVRWYGDHLYDISGACKPGTNQVTIKVVTTLGDYMKTLKNNAVAQAWTADTPDYPLGLTHPVELITQG